MARGDCAALELSPHLLTQFPLSLSAELCQSRVKEEHRLGSQGVVLWVYEVQTAESPHRDLCSPCRQPVHCAKETRQ